MEHIKKLTRPNGARINITVTLTIAWNSAPDWRITVESCPPQKRKFANVHNSDDYGFRSIRDTQKRNRAILAAQLNHVTEEELNEAVLECWKKLKPGPLYIPADLKSVNR